MAENCCVIRCCQESGAGLSSRSCLVDASSARHGAPVVLFHRATMRDTTVRCGQGLASLACSFAADRAWPAMPECSTGDPNSSIVEVSSSPCSGDGPSRAALSSQNSRISRCHDRLSLEPSLLRASQFEARMNRQQGSPETRPCDILTLAGKHPRYDDASFKRGVTS